MNPSAYVVLFGAGVASFANPCVLPLVPAYLGMIAGDEAGPSPHRRVRSTVLFVAGFTAVFAGLGVAAATLGGNVNALQSSLQRVGGIIVMVLGLIQLGAIRGLGAKSWHLNARIPHGPLTRPFVIGVTFGAAWTPCVGPLLGAALVAAAQSSTKTQGTALLVVYALGVGVPFIATSLALTSTPTLSPRLRRIGNAFHHVAGATLVALGLLLATGRYNTLTSALARFIPTVN